MEEREFNALADAMLRRIEDGLEAAGGDLDFELGAGGVLEIELPDGSKIIVNRHTAAREIWVAARSGGYHFRPAGDRWLATQDGEELMAALSRCLAEQGGGRIVLA
jgi:CyaY protein